MIGGNTIGVIQTKTIKKNIIGETEAEWTGKESIIGWLDMMSGDSGTSYDAKIQESTHVFLCDYKPLPEVTSENARMVINGHNYAVQMIDDPMGKHEHLEIFLKYVGGGHGVE